MTTRRRRTHLALLPVGGLMLALSLPGTVAGHAATAAPAPAHRGGPVDGRISFVDFGAATVDTVNPDGTALVEVTDPDTDGIPNGPAAWTPDGTHLVYSASRNNGAFTLYEIGTDGTGRHVLVPNNHDFFDFWPNVTPDGHHVLFARCRPDPPGGCTIVTARMNGTHVHPVIPYSSIREDAFIAISAISPSGKRLAFTRGNYRGIIQQVWVSRIDGSRAHPVTRPAAELAATSWTDDRHLVVSGPNAHLGNRLYLMPAAGGKLTLLAKATFPHGDFFGSASPSGDEIVFLGDEDFPDLSGNHLYVIDANGTGRTQVDVGIDTIASPRWGTAPLLPSTAGTPRSQLAGPLPAGERRHLEARLSRVPGWSALTAGERRSP